MWASILHVSLGMQLTFHLNNVRQAIKKWRVRIGHLVYKSNYLYDQIYVLQPHATQCGMLPFHLHKSLLHLLIEYHEVLSSQKITWHQKSHAMWLKEGDANTTFFHHSTILRHKRNIISCVKDADGQYILDLPTVKEIFISHFK